MDEGQNATISQMKMFLTRMGANARIVVTGDTTQVDLEPGTVNGLSDAVERLESIEGVGVVRLGKSDIVRHPLVQAIVDAYEQGETPHPTHVQIVQPPRSSRRPIRNGPPNQGISRAGSSGACPAEARL